MHAMGDEFHPSSNQLFAQLSADWIDELTSDDVGVVLSALSGLFCLIGIHPCQVCNLRKNELLMNATIQIVMTYSSYRWMMIVNRHLLSSCYVRK